MSRHQKAINRYIGIVFSLPLIMILIVFLFANPFTKTFLVWTNALTMYYFVTFLVAGLVAIFFEMPFTQPDALIKTSGGKFGTALVGTVGVIALVFASLILLGIYNIQTDTSFVNAFLAYIYLPVVIGMFGLEMYETIIKQRRFAVHRYAGA